MRRTFQKTERLKSEIAISALFREGASFMAYPLRVVWIALPEMGAPAQVAVSVSKKHFKTAVVRNTLKRRIREAYRLNKHLFYEKLSKGGHPSLALMLIYVGKEPLPYSDIEAGVLKMIRKFPAAVIQAPSSPDS